jgi:CubicO group peptidase (beta-lactamase class C family)
MDAERLERVRGLVAEFAPHEPGIALSVLAAGETIYAECRGLASLEHRIPVTPDTRFHIVSVTKTFTAAAFVILAAGGALSLDDEVRQHLPELPVKAGKVTIRHLLSMTSGLWDSLELERLRGVWRPSREREGDLLDLSLAVSGRNAAPGAQYLYCNAGFVLLGDILRRVTGQDIDAFRRVEIYDKLGLTATAARSHDGIVLPNLAEGYVRDGTSGKSGPWCRATEILGISGDTLTSSLADMTLWLGALRAGRIGQIAVTEAMATRCTLANGRPIHYGLGLAIRRYRGLTLLCHSGTQPGYKAHITYTPERDVGVVVLANREDLQPSALALAALEAVLEGEFRTSFPAAALPPGGNSWDWTARDYVDPHTGEWMRLSAEDGVLRGETLGDPFRLYPQPDGTFRDSDDYVATVPVALRPEWDGPGAPEICHVDLGGQACRFVRAEAPTLTADDLAQYTGIYRNAEIGSRHRIRAAPEGGLTIEYGPPFERVMRFPLQPIHQDIFLARPTAPGVSHRHIFRFQRDKSGRVTSAIVTMERLKGVRLARGAEPAGG